MERERLAAEQESFQPETTYDEIPARNYSQQQVSYIIEKPAYCFIFMFSIF